MVKSGCFGFFVKNIIMPKMGWMGHFWAQNQYFWTYLRICSLDFSDMYLMTDIKKSVKETAIHFQWIFVLCPKLEKWVIFGPRISYFMFHWFVFLDVFIVISWVDCYFVLIHRCFLYLSANEKHGKRWHEEHGFFCMCCKFFLPKSDLLNMVSKFLLWRWTCNEFLMLKHSS